MLEAFLCLGVPTHLLVGVHWTEQWVTFPGTEPDHKQSFAAEYYSIKDYRMLLVVFWY